MRRLRQTAWTVLVWLTAAGTLAAGIPHVLCRCADDRGPPVGPGPLQTGGCCCAAQDGPTSACECCQAKPEAPAPESPGGSDNPIQWVAPGCHKALSPSPTLTVSAGKANLSTEKAVFDLPTVEFPATVSARPAGQFPIARHSHSFALSDDLIIVLQHLII